MLGTTLGPYRIESEIGRGGMAVVYKAYQAALERYVAIKVLPQAFTFDPEFVERFLREARAAARLNHPHVVTIHDVGQLDGTYFMVMEYVDGPALTSVLRRRGRLPLDDVAQIISQVASALDYAHRKGFVHRDIKPGNILLDGSGRAKVTDFGIVKAAQGTRLTQTGTLLGTPEYMSPEQARGKPVGPGTDIYSLGVVAYEMLSGQVPFSGETMAVLHAHAYDPPDLSVLSPPLRQVVGKALAKDPAQRYQQAGALARALQALPSEVLQSSRVGPTVDHPTQRGEPGSRSVPGWMWGALGFSAAVMVLGLVLALSGGSGLRQASEPGRDSNLRSETGPVVVVDQTLPASTAALQIAPTDEPTPSPTPSPTLVPSPTVLPTDSPTPTALPTSTPMPTNTPIPSPTPCGVAVYNDFTSIWAASRERLGCASSPARTGQWMAEEAFERGRMLWREDTDTHLVLYGNGTWERFPNRWSEGMPTYTCGVPESPPTPLRGFGKVWCDYPRVRDGLGQATGAEYGTHGTLQDFVNGGSIIRSASGTYVLFSNGSWERR